MQSPSTVDRIALLLIAHGSRYAEANADLDWVADQLRARGEYIWVQSSFLELAQPTIEEGGIVCVERGATGVVMLPYFLSAGLHVREDLTAARMRLSSLFPEVNFVLAEPLGRHPLLIEVVRQRTAEAKGPSRDSALP